MNPYMRYYFERTCEEKSKGAFKMQDFSRKIADEWKSLSNKKK